MSSYLSPPLPLSHPPQAMKRTAATQALEELRKDRTSVDEEAKAARARSSKMEAARNEQRQKQTKLRTMHESEMNAMRGELRALKDQVRCVCVCVCVCVYVYVYAYVYIYMCVCVRPTLVTRGNRT